MTLDTIVETVFASFERPHPNVQTEANNLLARALQRQQSNKAGTLATRRNVFKRILAPLLPLLDAKTPELRESVFQALGSARIFLADEGCYTSLTKDIDETKRGKVTQAFNKIQNQQAAVVPTSSPPNQPSPRIKESLPVGSKGRH